ncbi:cupin domain-containing protein [Hydrogenophaga sp. BPS33]|uniref:cupin domain-containing protein n=1 Tax=Hydrogenophaga sp. BPS33 TaxID=2651974 RepID=UPI0013578F1D|nr:cupin domain-containing protein [Hydrogenophaga sp. BPS33]
MNMISDAKSGSLKAKKEKGNRFTDTNTIPWTSFFLNGVDYKLLDFAGERCTLLVKVEKGTKLAIHQHLKPVELYLMSGSFGYEDAESGTADMIYAGGYLYEPPGTVHEPTSPDGFVGVAVIHGHVVGFDAQGKEVRIGPEDYYRRAKENNAVAHLGIEDDTELLARASAL